MTLCSYHVTYAFQSKSTLYSCRSSDITPAWSKRVYWHSCNYRVWIHSETRTWHENIQSIDILETSRNGDRKIMESIRITSGPPSKKWSEPVEPVWKNIYQSNTYRIDLSLSHFNDEVRVQEKQQEKDQQSYIFVCLTLSSSN